MENVYLLPYITSVILQLDTEHIDGLFAFSCSKLNTTKTECLVMTGDNAFVIDSGM